MKPSDEQAQAIIRRVAQAHYVSLERLLGPEKSRYAYAARQAAAQELFRMGLTKVEIAHHLNRHQSTICNMLGSLTKNKEKKR